MVISAHTAPLEVMGTVVEVADLAWNAFERRHEQTAHGQFLKLEGELAHERSENQRLNAALEEYQKTIEEFKQLHFDPSHNYEDAAACENQQTESENCPSDSYACLSKFMAVVASR
eukprot:Gb_00980 [translate_table: standard]